MGAGTSSTSGHAPSIIMQNYYEAGPSGMQWTDQVLDVKVPNNSCPVKHPWLHLPPPTCAGEWPLGCKCSSPYCLPNPDQLVLAELILASFQKLQSAFTVEVLEDAHKDILASCKSSYNYMWKLCQWNNNFAAHMVTISTTLHVLELP